MMTNRPMLHTLYRGLGAAIVFCAIAFLSPSANAQYKHYAMGASAGFLVTSNPGGNVNAAKGSRAEKGYGLGPSYFSLGGHGGWRFEDNFAVSFEAHLSLHQCGVPNDVCAAGSTPMQLSVYTDLRYLFMTDSFRPYVNLGIAYWQTLGFQGAGKTGLTSFGPTLALGFEYFVAEEIALGIQVRYNLQLVVGTVGLEVFHGLHALFVFTTYV